MAVSTVAGATQYERRPRSLGSPPSLQMSAQDVGPYIPPHRGHPTKVYVFRFNSSHPGRHDHSAVQPPVLLSETSHLHRHHNDHWIGHSEETNSNKVFGLWNSQLHIQYCVRSARGDD